MLPAKNRLDRKKFKEIFSEGKRIIFPNFTLIYKPSVFWQERESRIGFIISSVISKKSTVRNKLKRRARAIIFKFLPDFSNPHFLIFIFRKQCLDLSFKGLDEEIAAALRKAGIMK